MKGSGFEKKGRALRVDLKVEGGRWRVEGGTWRVEGEEWRVKGGGWRVKDGGWREGGELRVEGGGWRVEGGGWRVAGGRLTCWLGALCLPTSSPPFSDAAVVAPAASTGGAGVAEAVAGSSAAFVEAGRVLPRAGPARSAVPCTCQSG